MSGWIKLHRRLLQNKLWVSEPFTKGQAWVDLLMLASYEDKIFWKRGIEVQQKRGMVGISEIGLADRWHWSRGKVRRFLKWLENEQQIVQQKSKVTTLIIIKNYDEYQQDGTTDSTTNGQQTDTTKKLKESKEVKESLKEKNIKKEKGNGKFKKPSLEQVQEYCLERKNNIDAEYFIDSNEAKGWKVGKTLTPMKCWKSTIRTWEKNYEQNRGNNKKSGFRDARKKGTNWLS